MIEFKKGKKKSTGEPVLLLTTPFHPNFSAKAQALGGRWDEAHRWWWFDPRDENRVRELCRSLWGTDGSDDPPVISVEVEMSSYHSQQEVWFGGRQIARRWDRDTPVRLGEKCVIVSGSFLKSAGSMKYPELGVNWVVLEVRDLPEAFIRAQIAADPYPERFRILEESRVPPAESPLDGTTKTRRFGDDSESPDRAAGSGEAAAEGASDPAATEPAGESEELVRGADR